MGNASSDGKILWLSGRFDDVVYAVNTMGDVKSVPVGRRLPHGLTTWPQPGRYSLGHTNWFGAHARANAEARKRTVLTGGVEQAVEEAGAELADIAAKQSALWTWR